jgi:hypothetical protein
MCAKRQYEDPTFDDNAPGEGGVVPYQPAESTPRSHVGQVLRREESRLMSIPGVKSVGEGRGAIGDAAIEVGIENASVAKKLPKTVDGIEIITRVIGEVDAY